MNNETFYKDKHIFLENNLLGKNFARANAKNTRFALPKASRVSDCQILQVIKPPSTIVHSCI